MTGPFAETIAAIRILRGEHWDIDACYALDRLIDAATALNNAAPYWHDDEDRTGKLIKHLRRAAISISAQYPLEPLTGRELEMILQDERSKAMREEAR